MTVQVRGQTLKGIGEAIIREAEVVKHLQTYLHQVPEHAKYFNVTVDPDGNPNGGDLMKAAQDTIGVRIKLAS